MWAPPDADLSQLLIKHVCKCTIDIYFQSEKKYSNENNNKYIPW